MEKSSQDFNPEGPISSKFQVSVTSTNQLSNSKEQKWGGPYPWSQLTPEVGNTFKYSLKKCSLKYLLKSCFSNFGDHSTHLAPCLKPDSEAGAWIRALDCTFVGSPQRTRTQTFLLSPSADQGPQTPRDLQITYISKQTKVENTGSAK